AGLVVVRWHADQLCPCNGAGTGPRIAPVPMGLPPVSRHRAHAVAAHHRPGAGPHPAAGGRDVAAWPIAPPHTPPADDRGAWCGGSTDLARAGAGLQAALDGRASQPGTASAPTGARLRGL